MQDWRQIAMDAKDFLTVCLARAIDSAMIAHQGENWFADFAEDDLHQKVNNRITKTGQKSVRNLDLQALLKFLRYRSELSTVVLTYHGFYSGLDEFSAQGQTVQLNNLLDRLISDFRNRIAAHSCATDIEKELSGDEVERIYGYEEAYQDMLKLARIFSDVKDPDGVTFHKRIADLSKKKQKLLTRIVAGVAALALTVALLFWLVPKAHTSYPEPIFNPDEINVQLIQLMYDKGDLVALCYVNNFTGRTITDVEVYEFNLYHEGRLAAQANFGHLEGINLKHGESIKWAFRFPDETIFQDDIDLKNLEHLIYWHY